MKSRRPWPKATFAAPLLWVAAVASVPAAGVHRCVDPVTKKVEMTDRPCGSAPLPPTPEEVASAAAALRAKQIADAILREARRADEQLLGRYRDDAALRAQHVADLSAVVAKIQQAMPRLAELRAARAKLDLEVEFYKGKPLPPELARKVSESEGMFLAMRDVFRGLEQEVAHLVQRHARVRERLTRLWAGEPPGSMGLLDPLPTVSAAR